jgi:EAL domain-containing protein (putative c-di-GMP-specific phosphodiesterase class I)
VEADNPSPVAWQVVERLLEAVRRHLDADLAYLTEHGTDAVKVRAVAGPAELLGLSAGTRIAFDAATCVAAVQGRIPSLLPDARDNRVVRRLSRTTGIAIGACAAVPVRLPDGTVFGALCALSREPLDHLTSQDERFLLAIAEVIAAQLAEVLATRDGEDRERGTILRVLQGSGLRTVLQPIIDLANGDTVGVEALTRFDAPPQRPPDVWFAEAARHRLAAPLEVAALRSALRLLPGLTDAWYLGLNASPTLIEDGTVATVLADAPLDRLVLEITEHAAVNDYHRINAELAPLRKQGLRLAIDDTGSGFASLRHVVRLRPDLIKMDGSLTRGLDTDPFRRALAASLADFAAKIGAQLVAEAVETPQDLAVLQDLRVPFGQGYLFAAPGHPDDLRVTYPTQVPPVIRAAAG